MRIINLTPHDITIMGDKIITIPASGMVARVTAKTVTVGDIDGIPITHTEFSDVYDLPDASPDTMYIVSTIVAQRCPNRTDLLISNESVRDEDGRIIGCRSLATIH